MSRFDARFIILLQNMPISWRKSLFRILNDTKVITELVNNRFLHVKRFLSCRLLLGINEFTRKNLRIFSLILSPFPLPPAYGTGAEDNMSYSLIIFQLRKNLTHSLI